MKKQSKNILLRAINSELTAKETGILAPALFVIAVAIVIYFGHN
jgi:hypothetical protein